MSKSMLVAAVVVMGTLGVSPARRRGIQSRCSVALRRARQHRRGSRRGPLFVVEHVELHADPARDRLLDGGYAPGTVVVKTAERRLYLVLGDGKALRYGIGVGRPGFAWGGQHTVTRKAEWPGGPRLRKRAAVSRICRPTWRAVRRTRSALAPHFY